MGHRLSKEEKEFIHEHGFTKRELKKLKKDFLAKGADKDRLLINRDQFKELFREHVGREALGLLTASGKHVDLDEIYDSMDGDKDELVSFKELCVWLGVYLKGSEEAKLKHMFKAFDLDGDGYLEKEEMNNVLEVVKLSNSSKLSDSKALQKAAELIAALDSNQDGRISVNDWVAVGKEAGLVEELLGEQFVTVMKNFRM